MKVLLFLILATVLFLSYSLIQEDTREGDVSGSKQFQTSTIDFGPDLDEQDSTEIKISYSGYESKGNGTILDLQTSTENKDTIEYISEYECRSSSLGQFTKTADTTIYQWVDSDGKTHFSDKPPKQNHSSLASKAFEGSIEYFDLAVHFDRKGLPPGFRQNLTVRVKKAYHVLASLLPASLLNKVLVDLWVFNDKSEYLRFKNFHSPGFKGSSQGFHIPGKNIAAAYRRNDKQVLETSVHEAVHVMNAGMFGYIPRWLNEGLAEYLEAMKVYGQVVELGPMEGWLRIMKKSRLSLRYVVESDYRDWQGPDRLDLYAHSWGLVYFLMSKQEGRVFLRDFFILSAKLPCHKEETLSFVESNYEGGAQALEQQFNEWLRFRPVVKRF